MPYQVKEAAMSTDHWPLWLETLADAAIDAFLEAEGGGDPHAFSCSDNYRYARCSHPFEVESFDRLAREGCCGSLGAELEAGGEKFLFGFNYGH